MYARTSRPTTGFGPRILVVLLVIWFAIGALAAGQRHYFDGGSANCAHAGTVVVTILAGPLNYVGANPKVNDCRLPQPSR
jgi:membrane associated rhomboid family serine protease